MTHTPRVRWPARVLALLGAVTLALLATAGPAAAHNVLISSDPADGATLNAAPATVSFTFDQPIENFDPVLAIIGPNGNGFAAGAPTVSGSVISARMLAGPAGQSRAAYRIVSADGHPVTGQITFTLTQAAAGSATGTPPSGSAPTGGDDASAHPSSGGLSAWLWIGIGVAAVLVVVAIVLALRRPASPHE